jgi:teichoic acid transport system permease protein
VALAAQHGLRRVDQASSFGAYLREAWTLRYFTWNYAVSRTILETINNRLGMLWQVLNPLLLSGVYYLAFGVLLGTKKDSPDFLIFLVGGVFTWQLFASTIQNGSLVLAQTKELTESLLFPRILLPIAVAIQEALGALGAAVVMFPIAFFYGLTPRWQWLLLPFSFILTAMLGLGLSFFTSRWVDKVFDLRQFIPLVLRVGMFLSGVFYDVSVRFAKAGHTVQTIANYNPAAILLKLTRAVFLPYELPTAHQLIWIGVLTLSLFLGGFLVFWRGERRSG